MTTETEPVDAVEVVDEETTTDRYITCGCGFEVSGLADYVMQRLFDEHECTEEESSRLSYVFSFWTFAIVAVIGYTVYKILTAGR